MKKFAYFAKDDKGSYIFTVTAKDSHRARRKIRDTGFSAYIDPNPWVIDDIIDLDNTEVAR